MDQSQALAPLTGEETGLQPFDLASLKKEQIEVLKGSVAKKTSDTELSYFLTVAQAQGLNPFLKEVWCYKRAKKDPQTGAYDYENADLIIMTGRDGFQKLAKKHPNFKKMHSCEVREKDTFSVDPISTKVEHRFGTDRGNIIGAYAIIEEKDGTKHFKYVRYGEYKAKSPIWESKPSAMICKCAEAILCKQFANISGIVAEETITVDGGISSSPQISEEAESLKNNLIAKIERAENLKELNEASKEVGSQMGKLFESEQQEIMDAGKRKREALEFRGEGSGGLEKKVEATKKAREDIDGVSESADPKIKRVDGNVVEAEIVEPQQMSIEDQEDEETGGDVDLGQPDEPVITDKEVDEIVKKIGRFRVMDRVEAYWNEVGAMPLTKDQRAMVESAFQAASEKLSQPTQ